MACGIRGGYGQEVPTGTLHWYDADVLHWLGPAPLCAGTCPTMTQGQAVFVRCGVMGTEPLGVDACDAVLPPARGHTHRHARLVEPRRDLVEAVPDGADVGVGPAGGDHEAGAAHRIAPARLEDAQEPTPGSGKMMHRSSSPHSPMGAGLLGMQRASCWLVVKLGAVLRVQRRNTRPAVILHTAGGLGRAQGCRGCNGGGGTRSGRTHLSFSPQLKLNTLDSTTTSRDWGPGLRIGGG